ncbi:hypothetical protein [Terasakiella sp.]|uniref:hypothetical protein n=1 Tax=Terasakiella sp. TaxID=2034861 RepID=UPI003AA805C6
MYIVTATQKGYYANKIIQEGASFQIKEISDFSSNWMATEDKDLLAALESNGKCKASPDLGLDAESAAAEIALLEDKVGELTTINEEAEAQNLDLKKQIEAVEAENEKLKKQLTAQKGEVTKLQNQLAAKEGK